MASYEGVPSIRLEGDQKRALALIPEAKVFLQQIQAFVKRAQVPTFSSTYRVDDDAYIYILCTGGQNIIHISAGVDQVDATYNEEVSSGKGRQFPDFLSGLVIDGTFVEEAKTPRLIKSFAPTPNCAFIHTLPMGRQGIDRLAVEPHEDFNEWKEPETDNRQYSQYQVPRASQWSGTMKKVVQVVMGLGRINPAKLRAPDDVSKEDSKYVKEVQANGVQLRYDYKFGRTHGIHRAPDDVLWLVEISTSRGVVATPLPIFPESDTDAFKDYAIAKKDTAMERALDELGCLPTGEGFPIGEEYTKALKRGDVIQLMTPQRIAEFYENSGYSSACGWSFNARGSEAHNVGYRYTDKTRLQQGVWYQISIEIGPIIKNRKPNTPIAAGSAKLVKQHDSYIRPTLDKGFCPFKYHEPLIRGLLSHNAQPLPPPNLNPGGPSAAPGDIIDVPIYVGFVGDDLKVARLFGGMSGGPSDPPTTDITPGECLYDGFWQTTRYSGGKSVPWAIYTNDFDRRRVTHGTVVHETLESQGLPHDPLYWGDFIDNPNFCYVQRRKPFKETRTRETRGRETLESTLIVPGYLRDGYYFAESHSFMEGRYGGKSTSYAYLTDPNVAFGWRDLVPLNSWQPWGPESGCSTKACGGKHKERRVVCLVKGSGGCSDFADSGPFIGMCEIIDAYNPNAPTPDRPNSQESWNAKRDYRSKITLVMEGLGGPKVMDIEEGAFEATKAISPDPDSGVVQHMYAQHNTIGDDSAMYQIYVDSQEIAREGYLPTTISDRDRFPAYIGVIQP